MQFATVKEYDDAIKKLEYDYDHVEGTEAEVYTRIVGYYRSAGRGKIRNWNIGKEEERGMRVPFANFEDAAIERLNNGKT